MKNKESLIRLYSVYFFVLFMGLAIVVQIFYLQIFKGEQLKSDANKQIFIFKFEANITFKFISLN